MRGRVSIALLVTIVAFMVTIAYFEWRAEPITTAPNPPRAPDVDAEAPPAEGFVSTNWSVDPLDELDERAAAAGQPAGRDERKEPTWAGSDVIMPAK